MPSIADKERDLYDGLWSSIADYKTSAVTYYLPVFRDIIGENEWAKKGTVLDAGCGTGEGGLQLSDEGFRVTYADLSNEGLDPRVPRNQFVRTCLWDDVKRNIGGFVDYAYCCDVMEHIPTSLTMLVVHRLLEVSRKGVFLFISMSADNYGVWVDEPLHKTVEAFTWWRAHLSEVATVVECRDLIFFCAYYLEPRDAQRV